MFITINGQLGSGKSEICHFFRDSLGFRIFSTGNIQRQYASMAGISTLEMNERSKSDYSLDHYIDDCTLNYAKANEGIDSIFDSRMAWFFVNNAFNIHLLVNPSVAAKRVYLNRASNEERYSSEDDALEKLLKRKILEQDRYRQLYNVQINDFSNYHLVLDTTSISIEETQRIVLEKYRDYLSGIKSNTVLVSPKNIYPTENIRNINLEQVEYYRSCIKNKLEFPPIKLIRVEDSLFIFDGHHKTIAANLEGLNYVKAELVCDENDKLPMNITPKEYISVYISDIYDWEDFNGFVFNYYPKAINRR